MTAAVALVLVALPLILAAASVLVTAVHTADEALSEQQTIWEYLADVYPWFPRLGPVGGLLALLAFGGVQCWLAWAGYAGGSAAALWSLLAVRLGDCVLLHWGPWSHGRRPNPGLMSTPLYALDAAAAATTLAGWWY